MSLSAPPVAGAALIALDELLPSIAVDERARLARTVRAVIGAWDAEVVAGQGDAAALPDEG